MKLQRPVAIACLLTAMAGGRVAGTPAEALEASIARTIVWLADVRSDPFTGTPADLRVFTVEVESWHRLSVTAQDAEQRAKFDRETTDRLRRVLDRPGLESVLSAPGGTTVLTELLVLAARCREHGIDPEPIRDALAARRRALVAEARRAPASIGALYAAYMPAVEIVAPFTMSEIRSRGMRVRRPAEVDLGLAEVYYLTHEIFADCDYGLGPLALGDEAERAYLKRILPFYTILYAGLGNLDIVGELIVCTHAAGLRDTYAYREGIRVLLERQNPDGSFGTPDPRTLGRQVRPTDFLHPTMNALTVLLLEKRSL